MINPSTFVQECIDEPQRPISQESIDLIFYLLRNTGPVTPQRARYVTAAAELQTLLTVYHVMTGVDLEQG